MLPKAYLISHSRISGFRWAIIPPWLSGSWSFLYSSVYSSLVAQTVKHLSTMRETWVPSLCQEDPLEKEMAIHSSTIARKIPWTEEPGRLHSPWDRKESDTTEWLHFPFLFLSLLIYSLNSRHSTFPSSASSPCGLLRKPQCLCTSCACFSACLTAHRLISWETFTHFWGLGDPNRLSPPFIGWS